MPHRKIPFQRTFEATSKLNSYVQIRVKNKNIFYPKRKRNKPKNSVKFEHSSLGGEQKQSHPEDSAALVAAAGTRLLYRGRALVIVK